MADPTASNMGAVVVADLNEAASIDGTNAAISTAVAMMAGPAGYLGETAGSQRVVQTLRNLMQAYQAEVAIEAREPRH